jgi:hypothetical protein
MQMTKVQKITLSPSRDIPFNKLVLSQSNVRRVKPGVSIEQLAESIAQRTLLQSLMMPELKMKGCAVRVMDYDKKEIYRTPLDPIPTWMTTLKIAPGRG